MRYFQVNQAYKSRREFKCGYLCAPRGDAAGWQLMRELRPGDLVFHYSSVEKMVFAVSRVVAAPRPRDFPGLRVFRFEWRAAGDTLLEYRGRHLSWEEMSDAQRKRYDEHEWYCEACTEPVVEKRLGDSFRRGEQAYLLELSPDEALGRLQRHGVIDLLEGKPESEAAG